MLVLSFKYYSEILCIGNPIYIDSGFVILKSLNKLFPTFVRKYSIAATPYVSYFCGYLPSE